MASFEERLKSLAGEDNLKEAKQLLKQHRLISAWRDKDLQMHAVFRGNHGKTAECCVTPGENASAVCSCCKQGIFCAHAAALLMYSGRFHPPRENDDHTPSFYGKLRKMEFSQLAGAGQPKRAKLRIQVQSASPHAPSKWDNMILSVRLETPTREYTGNQNNLRQLYFEKSLSVTLKFTDFPLHDQQLIRFLALYGEADNSNIVLDSEETAEFFHALPGFNRFCCNGNRIIIHPERAEAVLVASGGKYIPGLLVAGAALPFYNARVIAGRAGCWVGRDDEYFFVGGSCETGFLRSFFRSQPQQSTAVGDDFPLPVVRAGAAEPELRNAGVLLDGQWCSDGKFILSVEYMYRVGGNGTLFPPQSGVLEKDGKVFWKRDRAFENEFETQLLFSGAERSDDLKQMIFPSAEAGAYFLDRVIPELLKRYPQMMLASALACMTSGREGLPEIALNCSFKEAADDRFRIAYTLGVDGEEADWENIRECALQYREFAEVNGRPVKIPSELGIFMRASKEVLRKIDPAMKTFELPKMNMEYFRALTAKLPGAALPEIFRTAESEQQFLQGETFHFSGELRGYQQEGVAFLQRLLDRNLNALLADEMGLGKTVQLLALLSSRLRKNSLPALLLCPASLVVNWEREAMRFVPDLRVAAPVGSRRNEVLKEPGEFDLLILSYTAARLSAGELRKINFSYLILDEAQHIKNPGSGNAKNCKDLRAAHRIVLTGTPLENSPEDLWSVMDFLHPGMLGTLPAFRRRYAGIADDPEIQRDLVMRTAPFIKRRTKKEVASDLPSRTEQIFWCDLLPEQRALYDRILEEGRRKIDECRSDAAHCGTEIFSTLLKLRQVCCHPSLLPDGSGADIASAKMDLTLELLNESIDSGHKILLFSQFTSMLKLLMPELEKNGIPFAYLDGATRNRQQVVDNFNNNTDTPLFLLSLKAGGVGLNLTSADTVIIYDPWWNPAAELQAADRTHRIGQTRAVSTGKMVVRNSVEEKIVMLQERKRDLFYNLVENPASTGGFSLDELRSFLD